MEELIKNISYDSPIVLSYFFLCLVILIFNKITSDRYLVLLFETYRSHPHDLLAIPRLVTHAFGHADFDHFISNFSYILVLGPTIEDRFGSKNILLFIIATAFTIGIIHNLISDRRILGSSGVLYAFIVLTSYVNIESNKIPLSTILVCTLFISKEIIKGIKNEDNSSHSAHIIGALTGIIFIILIRNNII